MTKTYLKRERQGKIQAEKNISIYPFLEFTPSQNKIQTYQEHLHVYQIYYIDSKSKDNRQDGRQTERQTENKT
jgi:hypothetical protein